MVDFVMVLALAASLFYFGGIGVFARFLFGSPRGSYLFWCPGGVSAMHGGPQQ